MDELDKYPYSGHSAVMGKVQREWQNIEYVLSCFGKKRETAKRRYRTYLAEGISMGRRPELVGGGLIRSIRGWEAIKKMRLTGQDRIKSDQRILGGSDFVLEALSEAEESFTEKYALSSRGYDFEKVAQRVGSICELDKDYIPGKGRQADRVKARDVLCYWCNNKIDISMADLARRLGLTTAAVSIAVRRGEKAAKKGKYLLET